MSPIPRSWHWRELKITIVSLLCSLPIILLFFFNLYFTACVLIIWSAFILKNAYLKPININLLYAR